MKPALAAVGSATIAVLSQSSDIEQPFFATRSGHVVYNNCASTCCCTNSSAVASARGEVCVLGTPSTCSYVQKLSYENYRPISVCTCAQAANLLTCVLA